MLDKEICKSCINNKSVWGDNWHNLQWDEERVYCPFKYSKLTNASFNIADFAGFIDIKNKPPSDCPFIMEHVVMKTNHDK